MLISWSGLTTLFQYPQILREEPATVLSLFLEGGDTLRLCWTGMTVSAVLLIFSVLQLHRILAGPLTGFLVTGTAFGVLSGLVQVVGLIRWVLVVPAIAQAWREADSSQKALWESLFTAVNLYGGVAIGETLGYLFTGIWIVTVGLALLRTKVFHMTSGWVAIATGIGLSAGLLEHAGQGWAVGVNAAAYMVLLGLFLYFGIKLLTPTGKAPRV